MSKAKHKQQSDTAPTTKPRDNYTEKLDPSLRWDDEQKRARGSERNSLFNAKRK